MKLVFFYKKKGDGLFFYFFPRETDIFIDKF